jgi:serine/threonine-protein kinase
MANAEPQQSGLIGAVLSRRFRLAKLLGEGGMGSVYAADTVDGPVPMNTPLPGQAPPGSARVAIKILKPEFLGDPEVLARFLDEASTVQRLIHPNILRVFESLQAEDGSPYIVMELLEGVPLSAYTANGGRVPQTQAVTILQGMLAGLAAAHSQGVIHRDLKPENVFLAREPNGQFQVKLLDFGIAKVMDVAGGMGSKTKTGALLGTPAYMSPEQIKSSKDVDARADIWSAGVMGYEMLSGRVAFPAPTEYARLAAVLNNEPEPLEKIDRNLAPLAPLIARAMRKDRAERFQSALEMARALGATLGTQGSGAPPPLSRVPPSSPAGDVRVMPLSRLPDVPSLFAPSSASHIEASPAASSEMNTRAAEPVAPGIPDTVMKAPGSTLSSAPPRPEVRVNEAPPHVMVVSGSTMPSKDLPMLEAVTSGKPRIMRGVAAWVVVVLVVAALAAGFLLGFAVGRST